jgi:hypothetical protein
MVAAISSGIQAKGTIMLLTARILSGAVGVFMLYFVLGGLLPYPEFVVPDLLLGGLLSLSAIAPNRVAPLAIAGGCLFALGVYSVAVANQVELGVAINPQSLSRW